MSIYGPEYDEQLEISRTMSDEVNRSNDMYERYTRIIGDMIDEQEHLTGVHRETATSQIDELTKMAKYWWVMRDECSKKEDAANLACMAIRDAEVEKKRAQRAAKSKATREANKKRKMKQ